MRNDVEASAEIYCNAQSHLPKHCVVQIFDRTSDGWEIRAKLADRRGSDSGTYLRGDAVVTGEQMIGEFIDRHRNDRPADRVAAALVRPSGGGRPRRNRQRFKLPCPECGDVVEIREERLYPILDTLVANGRFDISLRGLAARLRH